VIGNCQAGWAAALLAADRPELTGPLVLNGSPLSYWAGVAGKNPLRYRGGLLGGIWLVSFLGDLGGGRFDGAHLVAGFEDLNPSNTHWSKFYHVYANVDTEEKRYLEFERWWTGFFDMTSDEIHFILRNLFIGNRLQDGEVELDDRKIDLRNLTEPVVIFSSSGDNITPPQQALNWILRVWDSVEEIQRQKQTIVYLLHEEIGHLGIFVSGKIANKEHKQIIGNLQGIDLLPPGLYEMLIEPGDKHFKVNDYNVRFEKRDFEDIRALGDADGGGEEAFGPVAVISDFNDRLYRTFVRPWVRALTTGFSAEVFRQLHPLRVSRYMSSDWNPLSLPVQFLAGEIKKNRRGVRPDNPFLKAERMAADGVASLLDAYRDGRDGFHEGLFRLLYENPSVQALFSGGVSRAEVRSEGLQGQATTWPEGSDVGGFAEAAVRVMVALADARQVIHASHLETYGRLVERHPRLSELNPSFRETMKAQAGILRADPRRALAALGNLVTSRDDRSELVDLAEQIAAAHPPILEEERRVLEEIRRAVNLEERRPPHVPDAS
jgi:tellurite resistance protein